MTWRRFTKRLGEHRLLLLAASWWCLWSWADELISAWRLPDFIEENPYARRLDGSFVFGRAFAHDLAYLAVYLAFGLLFVYGLGRKQRSWSQLPGALLLCWYGLEHFEGFLSNLWVHLGWFVPHVMPF